MVNSRGIAWCFYPHPGLLPNPKTTDLREGAKNHGFSSPVFMFLKTGEVQEGVEPDVSRRLYVLPPGFLTPGRVWKDIEGLKNSLSNNRRGN
jgi:hypothetical protein